MASFKKRYDAKQKKDAINMLKEVQKKIQDGEVIVDTFGGWQGTPGTWTFKVVVKESEDNRRISNL